MLRRLRGSLFSALLQLSLTLSLLGHSSSASSVRGARLPDGPEVVMESTRRDFGDVFAGEDLEQKFPVGNAGTKPLELERKSTLGRRSTAFDYLLTAAVWRRNSELRTRTAAARPAAPG